MAGYMACSYSVSGRISDQISGLFIFGIRPDIRPDIRPVHIQYSAGYQACLYLVSGRISGLLIFGIRPDIRPFTFGIRPDIRPVHIQYPAGYQTFFISGIRPAIRPVHIRYPAGNRISQSVQRPDTQLSLNPRHPNLNDIPYNPISLMANPFL